MTNLEIQLLVKAFLYDEKVPLNGPSVEEYKSELEAAEKCMEEMYDGYFSGHQEGYMETFLRGIEFAKKQMPHWKRLPCPADSIYEQCNLERPNIELGSLAEYDIISAGYSLNMSELSKLPKDE